MELLSLFEIVKRRWWLVLIPVVVAGILSLSALRTMLAPPVSYALVMRFTASAKPANGGSFQDTNYTPWLASEYAVNGIKDWIRTESFAKELSAALTKRGKPIAQDALRGVITSDNSRSMVQFVITGWPNADELREIGLAAVDALVNHAETYWPQFGPDQTKTMIVPLDAPEPVAVAVPITQRIAPLIRLAIGLALGLLLAFVAEYFDRTLRNRDEVEALGLNVIAQVPRQ